MVSPIYHALGHPCPKLRCLIVLPRLKAIQLELLSVSRERPPSNVTADHVQAQRESPPALCLGTDGTAPFGVVPGCCSLPGHHSLRNREPSSFTPAVCTSHSLTMDALKSAGRALIRSPSISRQSWGMARHQKLPENWTDTKESLQEGMVFHLKYLGVTVVDQPKGEGMAAAAIRRIITVAKASGKKFLKVTLTVSPRGIMLQDTITNELIENVSIYRISYCTADKTQDKVFAYIAQSQLNETLECHAFLCPKKKIAQAVTLTVAQAFRIAFDLWEVAQEEKCKKTHELCNSPETAAFNGATGLIEKDVTTAKDHKGTRVQNPIVSPTDVHLGITRQNSPSCGSPLHALSWEEDDGLDDAFSSIADGIGPITDLRNLEQTYGARMSQ